MGAAQHWGKTYKSTHMKTMMSRYVKYKNDPAWQQSQIRERPFSPVPSLLLSYSRHRAWAP
jgi:hypothetical protein